jgi:hypothetical protein
MKKIFLKKVLDIYPMRSYVYAYKEEHMKNKIINSVIPEAVILTAVFTVLLLSGVVSW